MAPNAIFPHTPLSPQERVTHKSQCGEKDPIRSPVLQLPSFPMWSVDRITAMEVKQSRCEVLGLLLTTRKMQTSLFTNESQLVPLQIEKAGAYLAG